MLDDEKIEEFTDNTRVVTCACSWQDEIGTGLKKQADAGRKDAEKHDARVVMEIVEYHRTSCAFGELHVRVPSMGYRSHATVKCHACKARRALGGSKKLGRYAPAERSGWLFVKNRAGDYVWLCPPCARKHQSSRS